MSAFPIVIEESGGSDDNRLLPFKIDGQPVRGRTVRLGTVADQILQAHDYPPPVGELIGEMLALTALLGSVLKFDGMLTVQAKGNGPVRFVIADYRAPREAGEAAELRAYAQFDAAHLARYGKAPSFKALMGQGYIALTLDQGPDMDTYQGIVELDGMTLSDVARGYFERSEQTPTDLRLACGRDPVTGHWRAGGIIVQHLSRGEAGGERLLDPVAEEQWNRASILMESVKTEELLDPSLTLPQLLYRLYHEDGVRVFDPLALKRGCRCNREKLLGIITTFSAGDREEMTVDGKISVTCEFCSRTFDFAPGDLPAPLP